MARRSSGLKIAVGIVKAIDKGIQQHAKEQARMKKLAEKEELRRLREEERQRKEDERERIRIEREREKEEKQELKIALAKEKEQMKREIENAKKAFDLRCKEREALRLDFINENLK